MKLRGFHNAAGLIVTLLLLLLAAMPAQGIYRPADGAAPAAAFDDYAFVQFADAPLASYDGSVSGYSATKPQKGQKLDLNSPAAMKYGNRLQAQRDNYKKWLAKQLPQVQVVTEYAVTFNGLGLKLNGATLKEIQGGPGAVAAGMSATYRPAMNRSTGLINAPAVWESLGGQENAGAGIKVGVIDSGIDQDHPFLQPNEGMNYPDSSFPRGDQHFTSKKVIVAKVYNQNPWLTPQAVGEHGTHVSGTIGGRAHTSGPWASELSGVAPGVWLGNYNVFPGNVDSAGSLFIGKAVEEAVIDGMDVLNLSLGGTAHRGKDLLEMAVDAAADAGVVVAIAAGNEGPGHYTVGSPGTADKVITVAAVSNSHTFAIFLESPALSEKALATTGDGNGALTQALTGNYGVWAEYAGGNTLACTPLSGTPLTGKIALLQRGTCTFSEKINNAEAAGAVAVVMYQRNDVPGDPIPMSTDGVNIPAVMISRDAGKALAAAPEALRTVSVGYPPAEVAVDANMLADFSSWGPTPNYRLKPDVAAPGMNIYSSLPGGKYAAWQGTSMATPHVAGAAALLRSLHSDWGPAEVKAALMATGHDGSGAVAQGTGKDPLEVGAGIVDLARAMNPPAMALPSSLSFELVRPVGNQTYAITFALTNTSESAQTYALDEAGYKGVKRLTLSHSSVTLAAGESAQVTATVADRGVQEPGQGGTPVLVRGYVTATSAAGNIRVPYLYVLDYNR